MYPGAGSAPGDVLTWDGTKEIWAPGASVALVTNVNDGTVPAITGARRVLSANTAGTAAIWNSALLADESTTGSPNAAAVVQPVNTTGSPTAFRVTGGAHTTLTASTEASDVVLNLARTVQFATGNIAAQRAVRVQAPTYGFVAASTITDAATVSISGAPIPGSAATFTRAVALWLESGGLSFGADPARSGMLRVGHATGITVLSGRSSGGGADVHLLRWHGGGVFEFGEGTANLAQLTFSANTMINFNLAGATFMEMVSGKTVLHFNEIQWRGGATTTNMIINSDNASAAANTTTLRGQSPGAANSAGGFVHIEGGQRSGTGNFGGWRGRLNASATENMVEATDLGSGAARILSLVRGPNLTTTEMPANTGDQVIYIGNASTAPTTGTPVSGGILYVTAGALRYKGTGGTDTLLGAADPHCQRCGRDFAVEHKNDKYGHQSICLWCLVDALKRKGVREEEYVIERREAA